MAGAGKKWLTGCGIGCGLLLLILGGVGTCSYMGVKKLKEQADSIEVSESDLSDRFGAADAFVPDPDGTIAPQRMEIFLAVRDSVAPDRLELSDILRTLDGERNWLTKVQSGMKMIPAVLNLIGHGRKMLMDNNMSPGEYGYIYTLSYYVLLQKDPADGPSFSLAGSQKHGGDGPFQVEWGNEDRAEEAASRVERVRGLVHRFHVHLLDNQIAAFRATLPADADLAGDPWGARLLAEQEAMGGESLRFLWEDGMPDQLRASLEPYRDRLAASYDPMTSVIELKLIAED